MDELVVFHPLAQAEIRAIAGIQVDLLRRRLAERQMDLQISEPALDLLGQAGFDPVYGARPLKRAIQQQLENALAQRILAGDFGPEDTICIDVEGERLNFAKQ